MFKTALKRLQNLLQYVIITRLKNSHLQFCGFVAPKKIKSGGKTHTRPTARQGVCKED